MKCVRVVVVMGVLTVLAPTIRAARENFQSRPCATSSLFLLAARRISSHASSPTGSRGISVSRSWSTTAAVLRGRSGPKLRPRRLRMGIRCSHAISRRWR